VELKGLESVDWRSLRSAYGTAEAVPERIRALAEDRGDAQTLDDLWQDLNHQGTVYEASAPAIPFLTKIAIAPDQAFGLEILMLIGSIAHGSSGPPYSPVEAGERAREVVAAAVPSLVEAARGRDWPFLVGVAYAAVGVASRVPDLLVLVDEARERERDPMGVGALSIAAYLLGRREDRLLVEGRSSVVGDAVFEDHVDAIDWLVGQDGGGFDEVELAEFLFDAVAASER
jgi:hypothetical protein